MRIVLSILLLLALIATAHARSQQTVHVQVGSRQGSGVLVGGTQNHSHRIILSVAHVTGVTPGRSVMVTVDRFRLPGVLVGADAQADASLVVVDGRHLKHIPPAALWLGELNQEQTTRSEGFAGRQFIETRGKVRYRAGVNQLVSSAATTFGMSGGPTYLGAFSPPRFVALNSQSDLHTMSMGPYRTYLYRWIPTLQTQRYKFTCNHSGSINMIPKGAVEGPIALPQPPPPTPEPEPAAASTAEGLNNDELKAQLGAELEKLLSDAKPQLQAQPQPSIMAPAQPKVAEDGVITINIPVRLRIRSAQSYSVEVLE